MRPPSSAAAAGAGARSDGSAETNADAAAGSDEKSIAAMLNRIIASDDSSMVPGLNLIMMDEGIGAGCGAFDEDDWEDVGRDDRPSDVPVAVVASWLSLLEQGGGAAFLFSVELVLALLVPGNRCDDSCLPTCCSSFRFSNANTPSEYGTVFCNCQRGTPTSRYPAVTLHFSCLYNSWMSSCFLPCCWR